MKRETFHCGFFYKEALEKGAVPAAYGRLMFLGAGGSGKSSLLDGLMGKPLRVAESTALADTITVSYQWIKAAEMAEEAWKLYTEEDEAKSLAAKSRQLLESRKKGLDRRGFYIDNWDEAQATKVFDISGLAVEEIKRKIAFSKCTEDISHLLKDVNEEIIEEALWTVSVHHSSGSPEIVMHIWDCGGQPVFLDIISAFLTPRTMFFLLFNSSVELENMYQELWHHKGEVIPGRDQNLTHRQLMTQWLQLIHSSFVTKAAEGLQQSPTNQAFYPRAMLIGTHRDHITEDKKEAIIQSLRDTYKDKALSNLIVGTLIVDNTTAGKGKAKEDLGYKEIRNNIHKFMKNLEVPTPLAWVAFRQAIQREAADNPILLYSEAVIVAEKCGIPERVVPSVLHFYHQLGAVLHYATIPSLCSTIIVKPQWLIDQFKTLLMPEKLCPRPQELARFWTWLEKRGILVQDLYVKLWHDCGLEGGPQALADLLVHFDLAQEIEHCPDDMKHHEGNKYFMPCILKVSPDKRPQTAQPAIRRAATLHIFFSTRYVPPGFFVRLIARMTAYKAYTPLFDNVVYRNSITFQCNEIDRVSITESLQSVSVDFHRKSMRQSHHIHFADACISLRKDLANMCAEVRNWLPSIKVHVGFPYATAPWYCVYLEDLANMCTKVRNWLPLIKVHVGFPRDSSSTTPRHFVYLEDKHRESTFYCETGDKECILSPQQKWWLPVKPPAGKVSELAFEITIVCVCFWSVVIH